MEQINIIAKVRTTQAVVGVEEFLNAEDAKRSQRTQRKIRESQLPRRSLAAATQKVERTTDSFRGLPDRGRGEGAIYVAMEKT
jgi:hypothetical protein